MRLADMRRLVYRQLALRKDFAPQVPAEVVTGKDYAQWLKACDQIQAAFRRKAGLERPLTEQLPGQLSLEQPTDPRTLGKIGRFP